MPKERVSVIGLGRMGGAMAQRLSRAGLQVTGWTRSGATARDFTVVPTLQEAVAASDVIVTSLLDEGAVRAVLGQLKALDLTGRLVVETSTVSPGVVRDFAGDICACGGRLMDAPISGGPETVAGGTAGFYLGGAPADKRQFEPIARYMSDRVVDIGPLGAGAAAKIVNNTAMAGAFHAIIDAIELGAAMGLPLETMLSFLKDSPGATPMFRARIPRISGADPSVGFSIETSLLNNNLFDGIARSYGVALPEMDHARARMEAAMDAGLGAQDPAALVRFVVGQTDAPH